MKREIRSTSLLAGDVIGVFGFGSFFRNEPFRDVDVLIVVEENISTLANRSNRIRELFIAAGAELSVIFDVKIFTLIEFVGKPLINMGDLVDIVPISERHQTAVSNAQLPTTAPS